MLCPDVFAAPVINPAEALKAVPEKTIVLGDATLGRLRILVLSAAH
jgi:hypothetical protein